MTAPEIVALIAAIAAPLGAYLLAARRFSGRIETSDAKDLWAESRAIRDWGTARIESLNDQVGRLEKRVATLEVLNESLELKNRALTRQVVELGGQVNGRS
jgi:hypothetical protein